MRYVKPLPLNLAQRYQASHAARSSDQVNTAIKLADEGQTPQAMVIACCDSRVQPEATFNGDIGDFFMYRNIANAVPAVQDELSTSTAAALQYGLTVLNIPHLIVMGHSRCGGVQGCHAMCSGDAPALEQDDSFVGRWLQVLRPAFERVQQDDIPADAQLTAMEQAGVLMSLENLLTHDFVKSRVEAGTLALHGTWLDIRSAEVKGYDPEACAFLPL